MTDRLAWFALGATFSAVLLRWPWRPRYGRMQGPEAINLGVPFEGVVQRGNGIGRPTTPKPNLIPRGQHLRSITFPDPDPSRRATNPYTGEPVQPNPEPDHPHRP